MRTLDIEEMKEVQGGGLDVAVGAVISLGSLATVVAAVDLNLGGLLGFGCRPSHNPPPCL